MLNMKPKHEPFIYICIQTAKLICMILSPFSVLIVTIVSSLITCLYGTPVKLYCNPCRNGQYTPLTPRIDYGVTKDILSNEVVNFYQVLNTAYIKESAALTQSTSMNDLRDLTPPCPMPTRHSVRSWIICVYDKISETLKNVTDNSIYSSTLNTNDIVRAARKVLCHFKLVMIQITGSRDSHLQTELSDNSCSPIPQLRMVTPGPRLFDKTLESLRVARNILYKTNETLVMNVLGRLFKFRSERSRRKGNRKGRKNKCKRIKNKNRKCKRRNRNRNKLKRRNNQNKLNRRRNQNRLKRKKSNRKNRVKSGRKNIVN
ncbi:uncharacterized protein LOC127735710 [Mytilus californianus]|uniref:uncharacterized protein LOC127735710 n=1 Tax=Mytilus californianus TaxID=6549 RepID=UPI002245E221|nr:uncharacterized protein LOC127735710 [Mytilus californianus]